MNKTIVENFDNLINDLYLNKPPNYSFKINSFKKARNIISSLDYKITIDNIVKVYGSIFNILILAINDSVVICF